MPKCSACRKSITDTGIIFRGKPYHNACYANLPGGQCTAVVQPKSKNSPYHRCSNPTFFGDSLCTNHQKHGAKAHEWEKCSCGHGHKPKDLPLCGKCATMGPNWYEDFIGRHSVASRLFSADPEEK